MRGEERSGPAQQGVMTLRVGPPKLVQNQKGSREVGVVRT